MPRSLRYRSVVILLLIFCGAGSSRAGWNLLPKNFGEPVNCAYFFDINNGLIGLGGSGFGDGTLEIWITSDGGNSWNQAFTPTGGSGRITRIFMQDVRSGFASIFSNNSEYSLWKTSDGGKSWVDFSQGNTDRASSVYATGKAIIKTLWYGHLGGSSVDGGNTFSQIFSGGLNGWSNGIDFTDDTNGVVTMGPGGGAWYSHDGGVTWNKSASTVPEAWSVHAVKGTSLFMAFSEDNAQSPGHILYWTQDGGVIWNVRNTTSFAGFGGKEGLTGDIEGVGNTLYVQTDNNTKRGIYRSDDLGLSWNLVGGPSTNRDTRFAVTGCAGEVVYAFDSFGGIWKTTDGGNGTLTSPSGTLVPLSADSLIISGTCLPARGSITLKNPNCVGYTIDSISFSPDTFHEFSVDSGMQYLTIYPNINGYIPIRFDTDSDITRKTVVHVHGHFGNKPFDLTINITAIHRLIQGPPLGLTADSVSMANTCSPARGYVGLISRNCDSLIIDTIGFSPNPFHEFSFDTVMNGLKTLSRDSVNIPILFQNDSDIIRETGIHIHAHSGNRIIDTTIYVKAQHSTVSGPIMSLEIDSLYMETHYCQPLREYITLSNRNCNNLIIDSVFLSPQYPELSIDTAIQKDLLLPQYSSVAIPVFFQTDSNLTRKTVLRIVGHSLERKIDTSIIIVAKHSRAPEPYLAAPERTKIGDTVLVPVFLRMTQDSFSITHFSLHLSYDGDILSPAYRSWQTAATLSAISTVTLGLPENNGMLLTVDLSKPLTQDSDLTKTLIYARLAVTLSRKMSCPIRLDTFSLFRTVPLPLCAIPETEFKVAPQCGDSTLSSFMSGTIPSFSSIHPNPNSGSEIEAILSTPRSCVIAITLVDGMGKVVRTVCDGKQYERGDNAVRINSSGLANGKYILHLKTSEGFSAHQDVIIIH